MISLHTTKALHISFSKDLDKSKGGLRAVVLHRSGFGSNGLKRQSYFRKQKPTSESKLGMPHVGELKLNHLISPTVVGHQKLKNEAAYSDDASHLRLYSWFQGFRFFQELKPFSAPYEVISTRIFSAYAHTCPLLMSGTQSG
jgi:hypothetical protein